MNISKVYNASIVVGLGLGMLLTGCSERIANDEEVRQWLGSKTIQKVTEPEFGLLQDWNSQLSLSRLVNTAGGLHGRSAKPDETDIPFCDVAHALHSDVELYSLKSQYKKYQIIPRIKLMYGESAWGNCINKARGYTDDPLTEMEDPVLTPEAQAAVEGVLETVVSVPAPHNPVQPDTLQELLGIIKTCNVAKVKIIAKDSLQQVTETEARDLINQCQWNQIRTELNR